MCQMLCWLWLWVFRSDARVVVLLMAAETDAPRAGHHRLCLNGEGFDDKAMV